jgi:hypothetical protein
MYYDQKIFGHELRQPRKHVENPSLFTTFQKSGTAYIIHEYLDIYHGRERTQSIRQRP